MARAAVAEAAVGRRSPIVDAMDVRLAERALVRTDAVGGAAAWSVVVVVEGVCGCKEEEEEDDDDDNEGGGSKGGATLRRMRSSAFPMSAASRA